MTSVRLSNAAIAQFMALLDATTKAPTTTRCGPNCMTLLTALASAYRDACADDSEHIFDTEHFTLLVSSRDSTGWPLGIQIRWFRYDAAALNALQALQASHTGKTGGCQQALQSLKDAIERGKGISP